MHETISPEQRMDLPGRCHITYAAERQSVPFDRFTWITCARPGPDHRGTQSSRRNSATALARV